MKTLKEMWTKILEFIQNLFHPDPPPTPPTPPDPPDPPDPPPVEYVKVMVCGKTQRLPSTWCPKRVMKKFKKGEEPKKFCVVHKERITMVKNHYLDTGYAIGYVPWDAHALNLPFTEKFTWKNWCEGVELMAKHGVNFVRFFLASSEDKDFPYILPFKMQGKRYNLLDTNCPSYDEIYRRLNEFWKRGITTLLCLASGVKNIHNRFDNCVWNGNNNVNGTCTDASDFMRHKKTKVVLMGLIRHLEKDRKWWKHPVVYEVINEHGASAQTQHDFYSDVFDYCLSLGIVSNQLAFEFWDSGKVEDLLEEYDCVCPKHGYNSLAAVERAHKGEMQNDYFNEFSLIMLDSDGQVGEEDHWGQGLVGVRWNPDFRRFAPTHIKPSFGLDFLKEGGGIIVWSGGAYYKNENGNAPDYKAWKKVALEGLNATQLKAWKAYYLKKRKEYYKISKKFKLPPSNWDIDPSLFATNSGKPLGELKAIKQASEIIFD